MVLACIAKLAEFTWPHVIGRVLDYAEGEFAQQASKDSKAPRGGGRAATTDPHAKLAADIKRLLADADSAERAGAAVVGQLGRAVGGWGAGADADSAKRAGAGGSWSLRAEWLRAG